MNNSKDNFKWTDELVEEFVSRDPSIHRCKEDMEDFKQSKTSPTLAKEIADNIWHDVMGKNGLMYNEASNPKIHTKHDLCEAMGCVKYDEKIHNQ